MMPEKDLVKAVTQKQKKGLHNCLECRLHFTPLVLYAKRIPVAEAQAATQRIAFHLSFRMKQEYSDMCGFVRTSMSISVVWSNNFLIQGKLDKEARIVMALLSLWWR